MRVTVGRIGRPHGIRGEVVVSVRTDDPELRFAPGSRLDTEPVGLGPLTVASFRWQSGQLIVTFAGIADRNAAGELRGCWLMIDSSQLESPEDPDEFLDHELIGLTVETASGEPVGVVADVLHHGQDLLSVRHNQDHPERIVLIPFVKAIVPVVDVSGGRLVIDPPPGLLDPEEAV